MKIFFFFVFTLLVFVTTEAAEPNVIFVLADDFGLEISPTNQRCKIKTPHCKKWPMKEILFTMPILKSVCTPPATAYLLDDTIGGPDWAVVYLVALVII